MRVRILDGTGHSALEKSGGTELIDYVNGMISKGFAAFDVPNKKLIRNRGDMDVNSDIIVSSTHGLIG